MTGNPMQGPRLFLRRPEVADARRYVTWLNDPEIRRTLSFTRPVTLFREEQYLEHLADDPLSLVLAVCENEGETHIGGAGLHKIELFHRRAELGLFLGEKHRWGRGYGREILHLLLSYCFNQLDLNRVYLHVYPFNARAIHLYESLGFRQDGALRDALFREGRYHDVLEYSILQREYREHSKHYPGWVKERAQ